MNTQTIFTAGNSQVVSIPKSILADMKLKTGDKVIVEKIDEDNINIKKAKPLSKTSPFKKSKRDFDLWWNSFLSENREVLDELAIR